jgi:aldehyde dehydrogenase (NAD+)
MIRAAELFSHMGLDPDLTDGGGMDVRTPIDGSVIGSVMDADRSMGGVDRAGRARTTGGRTCPATAGGISCVATARCATTRMRSGGSSAWRRADPERGPGRGQEMIDICDFAVSLASSTAGPSRPSGRGTA